MIMCNNLLGCYNATINESSLVKPICPEPNKGIATDLQHKSSASCNADVYVEHNKYSFS